MQVGKSFSVAVLALLAWSGREAPAQLSEMRDQAAVLAPARPLTQQEANRRKALALYGLGILRLKQDRLVEATHLLEDARQLDGAAAAIQKALVPLYLALGRRDDALESCQGALDLDPGDHETWSLYGRQLRGRGKTKEAQVAFRRALQCPGVAECLDLHLQLQYELGALHEESEQFDQALAAFAEVVKGLESAQAPASLDTLSQEEIKQQAASTLERMIKLCIQAKEYDRGLRLFAEAEPRYPILGRKLNFHLAKVHAAQGHPDRALVALDAFLRSQPPGADAYELRLNLLKELHREDEILPSLRTFSALDSKNVALRLLLARQAALAGRGQEAEALYRATAEESPTAEIYRGLFNIYRTDPSGRGTEKVLALVDDAITRSTTRKGKPADLDAGAAAKARAMLLALREDVGLAGALLPLAQEALQHGRALDGQTEYFLAILAYRARRLPEAEFFFRRCVEHNDDPQREAAVYGGLLEVLWLERKYDAVVDLCRQGLRQAKVGNQLLFYERLPRALVLLGKTDEALSEADKAVAVAPEENQLMFRLLRLWVLGKAGRTQQAVADALAMLNEYHLAGQVRNIHLRLYELYSDAGDLARAEEQLQQMLKADSSDALVNNNLGYLWAEQGKNLEEAERLIRKAIELTREQSRGAASAEQEESGENAEYLDSLGWVLFRRGQVQEARRWLERAAALPGGADDPTVWDHLGELYVKLEEPARARTAWQKALLLYAGEKRRKDDDNHAKEVESKLKRLGAEKQHP